jgi:hypothetical protein
MAYTYSKIATYTVGSGGVASISFLNIPQTYTDLIVSISARSTFSDNGVSLRTSFNNDTGNITVRELRGSGSAAASYSITYGQTGYLTAGLDTANTFGSASIYIPNYTSSNYKSSSADVVSENNATAAWAVLSARLWSSTSPITTITLSPADGNWAQYSSAHLYGIKAEL